MKLSINVLLKLLFKTITIIRSLIFQFMLFLFPIFSMKYLAVILALTVTSLVITRINCSSSEISLFDFDFDQGHSNFIKKLTGTFLSRIISSAYNITCKSNVELTDMTSISKTFTKLLTITLYLCIHLWGTRYIHI